MEVPAVRGLPELLAIEVSTRANGEHVLTLCGELDLSNASSVLAHVIDSDLGPDELLVIDLAGVTFVDSSGLIALLHAEHYLTGRSCHFALRRPTRQVLRVLELAGLADSFRIIDTSGRPNATGETVNGRVTSRGIPPQRPDPMVADLDDISATAPDG
jgi:anti-anti-sigma factor